MSRQQRRALSRCADGKHRDDNIVTAHLSLLIDGYVRQWLVETNLGRGIVQRSPSFEDAVAGVIELLNVGFLKIHGTPTAFTGIETLFPPEPPAGHVAYLRRQ